MDLTGIIFLLALSALNVWFTDALSSRQLISWLLLALSILAACLGFVTFYRMGKPEDGMEKTTELITAGIYRYIRHPRYLSLILGGYGAMLKDP